MRIDCIHLDDWCFMYIDGTLKYHHHDGLTGNAWETLEPLLRTVGVETYHWSPEDQEAHGVISDWTNWRKGGPPQQFTDCLPYVVQGFGGYY